MRILNASGCLDALAAPDVAKQLDAFKNSKQDFLTWVGETRVRTNALRMALPIEPTRSQLTAS